MPGIDDQVKSLHCAEPFKPFALVLDDGRRIVIDRREFLGRFSTGDRLFYSTPHDTTEIVEIKHISRVEPTNGDGGRRRRAS